MKVELKKAFQSPWFLPMEAGIIPGATASVTLYTNWPGIFVFTAHAVCISLLVSLASATVQAPATDPAPYISPITVRLSSRRFFKSGGVSENIHSLCIESSFIRKTIFDMVLGKDIIFLLLKHRRSGSRSQRKSSLARFWSLSSSFVNSGDIALSLKCIRR